jgi:hypothetical protein
MIVGAVLVAAAAVAAYVTLPTTSGGSSSTIARQHAIVGERPTFGSNRRA